MGKYRSKYAPNMQHPDNKEGFIEISGADLVNLERLADTGYVYDYFNIFRQNADGAIICQEEDMDKEDRIRIRADLAVKIWAQVESTDIGELYKEEMKASEAHFRD